MTENADKILGTLLGIIVCIYINNVLRGLIVLGTVQRLYAEKVLKKKTLETK